MALPPGLEALLARYGAPPPPAVTAQAAYGTQAAPLDSFAVDGRTGNKTTNKDLPDWLRKLGMKGDAYAGGMLKPQIRYGFWFKDGKINFADGTSYAAKKNKDGSFAYTDSAGKAATYSPTDEQNAYNKKYKASTSNQSFLDKATNTIKFELDHGQQIIKGIASKPTRIFTGIDPLSTKLWNGVTGSNNKPLVDQLGGALPGRYADYTARTGNATGFAKPLQGVAHVVAGVMGANGATHGLSQLAQGAGQTLGTTTSTAGGSGAGGSLGAGNVAGDIASSAGGGLPEIVVTGTRAGLTAAQQAAAAAAGGALGATYATQPTIGSEDAGGAAGGSNLGGGKSMAGWTDWIGPAINAGAAIYGGTKANQATDAASRAALAENARQFDLVRSDTAGVRALGNAAVGRLADLNGYNDTGTPNYDAFRADPGYQFNLSQGLQAVERGAAARGGLLSGAAGKALQRTGAGIADQQYSAYVDRLMQQAGLGNTGIGASAAAGQNSANNVSNIQQNAGNARASSYWNMAQGVNNSAQGGLQNQLLQRYLNG